MLGFKIVRGRDALAEEAPLLSALLSASILSSYRPRLGWAALLARVSAVDVTLCPSCGGRLRLVAVLSDPAAIRSYLSDVGLTADPLALAAARLPPQRALELVV